MTRVTTSNLVPQNKFSTTLAQACTSTDTTIYLNSLPTASEGFLTIDEGLSTEEVIFYNSKGSNFVTCPSAADGRGVYGSAVGHSQNASVKMKVVAEYYRALQDGSSWTTSGNVLQVQSTNFSAVATGTTIIPYDDSIPQITEGTEFMTLSITPKATTNLLLIDIDVMASHSVATYVTAALFQDSTANALAAKAMLLDTGAGTVTIPIKHKMTAGTTSSTTFRVRIGPNDAGTLTFNGTGGARRFGGITVSNITITEIKV